MKQEIKIGKFRFLETWIFPNDVNKFINAALEGYGIDVKNLIHVFCGRSKIGGFRVDIDKSLRPDLVADCRDLPAIFDGEKFDAVLADFPWQISYPDRRAFSYALRDICKEKGILILNCPWNPWVKGLKILQIFKVSQAFNSYRDLVDFWIMQKNSDVEVLAADKNIIHFPNGRDIAV